MDWNNIAQIAITTVVIGGGAVIVKLFISRAFKSIDKKLDEFFSWVNDLDNSLQESEKNIVRLEETTKIIETDKRIN